MIADRTRFGYAKKLISRDQLAWHTVTRRGLYEEPNAPTRNAVFDRSFRARRTYYCARRPQCTENHRFLRNYLHVILKNWKSDTWNNARFVFQHGASTDYNPRRGLNQCDWWLFRITFWPHSSGRDSYTQTTIFRLIYCWITLIKLLYLLNAQTPHCYSLHPSDDLSFNIKSRRLHIYIYIVLPQERFVVYIEMVTRLWHLRASIYILYTHIWLVQNNINNTLMRSILYELIRYHMIIPMISGR